MGGPVISSMRISHRERPNFTITMGTKNDQYARDMNDMEYKLVRNSLLGVDIRFYG